MIWQPAVLCPVYSLSSRGHHLVSGQSPVWAYFGLFVWFTWPIMSMWNFQDTYELPGVGTQTCTFEIRVGHRPTSWTSISKFLSQRTLGENACTVAASCLFGGSESEQFRAPRPRKMVSCQKINTFVGCRSRNSLQRRRRTYVRLHTANIAAYYDIIPRIPGSWRAGFLSTTVLTAPFA